MEKLKRAVIKEELVALTGDFKKAIVLNQMIYWCERTKDVDKYIQDEKKRSQMAMGKDEMQRAEQLEEIDLLTHGWIYKSAEELSEETMMGVSKPTMGRYLNELVSNGWLDKRKNPHWKGDNTFQYRVNMIKIQTDLHNIGYSLEGYPLLISVIQNETTEFYNDTSEFQNEIGSSKIEQPVSKSNSQFQNETTLPETTTEITSKTKNISSSRESIDSELFLKYPNVPFNKIKEELLNDDTATITTDKQYKSMLEYRLKNYKPKQPRVNKSAKKPIRKELLPTWFDEPQEEPNPPEEKKEDKKELERKKKELEEMMKKLLS